MSPKLKIIQDHDPDEMNGVVPLPMRDDDDVDVTISDVEDDDEAEE